MDGIIVVNKPEKFTSHDIVNKIRKELNIKKVGHAGTLDPLATGVLPILLGEGTKLSKYLINHDKEYIATIKLGEKTDTGDITGKVIKTADINNYSKEDIINMLKSFEGKQEQIPPMYSAIKINGKKLYEYARKGQTVDIESRIIEIYEIELLGFDTKTIEIRVKCSKGTYIRRLCEDIAEKIGTVGTMAKLQRTQVGDFRLQNSIELEELTKNRIEEKIITIEQFFNEKGIINLDKDKIIHFLNGVKLTEMKPDGLYRIYDNNNRFIGIGIVEKELLKREIVVI